jgi:hypothetical protein
MKEGLKRILGRTGDFLFGGLFILVGIWIIVFIVAHVVTGVHLPEQPSPLVWLLLLLQAFLGYRGRWCKSKLILATEAGVNNLGACRGKQDWMPLGPCIT